jgi:Arc/MetJ-type ribon-helix-helix transcriptional regulator
VALAQAAAARHAERRSMRSRQRSVPLQADLRVTVDGMIVRHTAMPKTKVALTLDAALLERVDELVAGRKFRNRSQAVEAALADKLQRLARTRLARESAKLNPREEKRVAEEGLVDALDGWPEY